jgi:exopolysaccharide biosynthesis protein
MTLNELSAFMVELGCVGAMNLDGGGSATLWYDGRVRNRPCDGNERQIANTLIVRKKENGTEGSRKAAAAEKSDPGEKGDP